MSEVSKKDFVSTQEVRWCPGCGNYSIMASIQNALAKMEKRRENLVFVSGIGCSSRFPYYMETYGMHTIHGRALPIASGVKLSNPDLSVWVVTGDGDAMSIGGNHLIHAIRRNLNINVIMFNNEIYGLTKGQYSPTTKKGTVTYSSPYGSIDRPFTAAQLALGSSGTFYARTLDTDLNHMRDVMIRAEEHKGLSFVEVYQNCVIYSDKVHADYTGRATRDDNSIRIEHGKPMIYGKKRDKGLIANKLKPEIVTIGENGITEADLIVHDETDPSVSCMLSRLRYPEFPVPYGVFNKDISPVYDDDLVAQIDDVTKNKGAGTMHDLLFSGNTWEVD